MRQLVAFDAVGGSGGVGRNVILVMLIIAATTNRVAVPGLSYALQYFTLTSVESATTTRHLA